MIETAVAADDRKFRGFAIKSESDRFDPGDADARPIRAAGAPEQLDTDPWLLNVENGTLDLRTGELRPHRRDDLLEARARRLRPGRRGAAVAGVPWADHGGPRRDDRSSSSARSATA